MSNSMVQFRSVVLTSANPEYASLFYQFVVGLEFEAVHSHCERVAWTTECGGVEFTIHHADALPSYASPPFRRSNLTHLYFKLADRGAFLERLERLGICPVLVDEHWITVEDPDGRLVIFGG